MIQMMTSTIQIGSRVRLQHDDGWGSPGCVMSQARSGKLCIYWPDENILTSEHPADLVPYGAGVACQPGEFAAA